MKGRIPMKWKLLGVIAGCAWLSISPPAYPQGWENGFLYSDGTFRSITPPGGASHPRSINKSGQIVGDYSTRSGETFGYLYNGRIFTRIAPSLSRITNSFSNSINDAGQILGTNGRLPVFGTPQSGYLYNAGRYTTIQFPSFSTSLSQINNSGQIIGNINIPQGNNPSTTSGFLYSGGKFSSINFPGSTSTTTTAINKSGQIVGTYVANNNTQGFLYSNGSYTTIQVPGSIRTSPIEINDLGQIVGSFVTHGPINQGFLYDNGSYKTINFPGSTSSNAYAINNLGQIVGAYNPINGPSQGFLYSDGVYSTISNGGNRTVPTGINDSGQIIGYFEATAVTAAAAPAARTDNPAPKAGNDASPFHAAGVAQKLAAQSLPSLIVTPSNNIEFSGPPGGPFSPSRIEYRISASIGTIRYSIRTPTWLTANSTAGSTDTKGITIMLTVNPNASRLSPGAYGPAVAFQNVSNGQGSSTRPAKLTVQETLLPRPTNKGEPRD